ncbi:hypothetical protein IFM89_027019 [Coptis chinensis]|uniref:Clp1 N-terminal domain-containing protein n=1 Tax=Coptis chinensis TaxID=261450 RepID=A0A835I636_9MAGN|nr:hypothetical protein IFM89_027019 [Coptis chinensis]
MNSDGRPSGEAYVEFANADDSKVAMSGEDEWFYGGYANLITEFVKKKDIPIGGIQSAEIYLGRDTRPIELVGITETGYTTDETPMISYVNVHAVLEGRRNRAKASPIRDSNASQLGMYGHGVWKKVCIIFHLNCVASNIDLYPSGHTILKWLGYALCAFHGLCLECKKVNERKHSSELICTEWKHLELLDTASSIARGKRDTASIGLSFASRALDVENG